MQEAERVRQRIEEQGFLPGIFKPAYAVAVVEHCESLCSRTLAAIHLLDNSGRLHQNTTTFSVEVQPVDEADSNDQSRGPSGRVTRKGCGGWSRGTSAGGGAAGLVWPLNKLPSAGNGR